MTNLFKFDDIIGSKTDNRCAITLSLIHAEIYAFYLHNLRHKRSWARENGKKAGKMYLCHGNHFVYSSDINK